MTHTSDITRPPKDMIDALREIGAATVSGTLGHMEQLIRRSDVLLSDDAINLDKEIALLRDQLARKLQIQNTQLKRMLQRFER